MWLIVVNIPAKFQLCSITDELKIMARDDCELYPILAYQRRSDWVGKPPNMWRIAMRSFLAYSESRAMEMSNVWRQIRIRAGDGTFLCHDFDRTARWNGLIFAWYIPLSHGHQFHGPEIWLMYCWGNIKSFSVDDHFTIVLCHDFELVCDRTKLKLGWNADNDELHRFYVPEFQ